MKLKGGEGFCHYHETFSDVFNMEVFPSSSELQRYHLTAYARYSWQLSTVLICIDQVSPQ